MRFFNGKEKNNVGGRENNLGPFLSVQGDGQTWHTMGAPSLRSGLTLLARLTMTDVNVSI